MMLTEDQAAERWCPMVRKTSTHRDDGNGRSAIPVAVNVDAQDVRVGNCCAAGCVMWRWAEAEKNRYDRPNEKRRGYCGLAGKPTL